MMRRSAVLALVSMVVFVGGVAGQEARSSIPDPLLWELSAPARGVPVSALDAATPVLDAESVEAFFDAAFHVQRIERALVGATVSVVHRGEVIFERGYGFADLERRLPVDPETTLFRIGSISKPFVWTALMQLVEQGLVDLDDPVERYIDFEIPDTFDEPIRVWHLLTHTPGFEEGYAGFVARTADEVRPLGEALADVVPGRVNAPGTFASYSNYGSALAGYIVERVAGAPWATVLEQGILEPLELKNTNVRTVLSDEHRRQHARGYAVVGGELVPTPWAFMHLEPAGAISSTASDMARFMLVHLNGGTLNGVRILGEETTRRMHSPLFDAHPDLPPMLHGFYRTDRNGQVVFGHGGNVNQFHSDMILLPESEVGVFVSFNSDPGAVSRGIMTGAFIDHFFPREHLADPPVFSDVDISQYQGEYVPLRTNFTTFEKLRTLFMGGTQLSMGTGETLLLGRGTPIVPTGPDRFAARYGGPTVVFERDDAGRVSHMIAGSPLGTFTRVHGLDRPSVQANLFNFAFWIAALAVFGWTVGLVHRVPSSDRLPGTHRFLAVVQCAAFLALVTALQVELGQTAYGVSGSLLALAWGLNANLGLGLMVVVFATDQWWRGSGTGLRRAAYSIVAASVVVQAWFVWSFNLLGGA
ncbi:MAG: serine hydrolase domain-containing protein [Gemmatimonadota bacterium]